MPFSPEQPFNDLPPLPPAPELETRAVLKALIEARAALAELKATSALIPEPSVLINAIPLLEAQASSEIENIVTTTDRLFQYAGDESGADSATKEALRYRTALREGFESLATRPLTTATAVQVCRRIKGIALDIRATPGTMLLNDATGRVVYTPPVGADRIRDMLALWERYIHEAEETDPLVRMALMHYQFEAIHPFTDGNGRTGRILNILYLVEQGLIDQPILYLSGAIIRRKADYYRLLLAVTVDAAWEAWILFMLSIVEETARWTVERIGVIRRLIEATAERVRVEAPKIYSRELIETIFVQPYCRIETLVASGIAQRQSASRYLKALADLGILEERKAGREKIFVNPAFLRVLAAPLT
ncbi:addiction module protein [Prosthecomicrobium hirschii]|uniref:Addiction module protein n=1 Tax=Prosthecodimorpha hirschii TaxID=665126 RepID=A0A0P6VTW9_9HYPH|nr:Fic family protein [Prosthecomicrobium hirschii]KPL55011.1 addiction module protein [Prosthecomicrobium hirschii]